MGAQQPNVGLKRGKVGTARIGSASSENTRTAMYEMMDQQDATCL